MIKKLVSFLTVFLVFGILMVPARAQYQITQAVIGNGGNLVSNAAYQMGATLGQAFIGRIQNASNVQEIGFWYTANVYVGIENTDDLLPKKFELYQNYPNPFNPVTHIKYAVPKPSRVRIEIYNILGQRMQTLLNEEKPPGYYVVEFEASSMASGFYIYRMQAEGFIDIRKMIVIK